MADWSSFTNPQVLAIWDAFDTAAMETSLGTESLLLYLEVVEEMARRDLFDPDHRAAEVDFIISFLVPSTDRIIVTPPPAPLHGLPGVQITIHPRRPPEP
jgi:hypothetical protein